MVITSYEVVMRDRRFLEKHNWKLLVVDEVRCGGVGGGAVRRAAWSVLFVMRCITGNSTRNCCSLAVASEAAVPAVRYCSEVGIYVGNQATACP